MIRREPESGSVSKKGRGWAMKRERERAAVCPEGTMALASGPPKTSGQRSTGGAGPVSLDVRWLATE